MRRSEGESLENPSTPCFLQLSGEDGASDTPPQHQQLSVGFPLRLESGGVDVPLEFRERGCEAPGIRSDTSQP